MKEVMWRVLAVLVAVSMAGLLLYHKFGDRIATLALQVEQAKEAERPLQQLKNEPEKNGCADGCIYFGTDGPRAVLTLDQNVLRVHNLRTGEALSSPLKHDGFVFNHEFSPDGKRLLTWTISKQVAVWDVQSGKKVLTVEPENGLPLKARFVDDGNSIMAVVLGDKTSEGRSLICYVWNAQTGQLVSRVQHKDRSPDWNLSADGEFVLSTSRTTARVWATRTGEPVGPSLEPGKGWHWLSDIEHYLDGKPIFSNDNKRVVTLEMNSYGHLRLQLRDVATGKTVLPAWNYERGPTILKAVGFSPDGRQLATVIDGNEPMRFRVGEERPTTALPPGEVTIWDTQSGQRLTTCRYEQRGGVSDLVFSPDGRRLAVSCVSGKPLSASVSLFDTATGSAITPPFRFEKGLRKTAFTPDGTQLIVVGVDGYAGIWDAKMGREISRVQVPPR